MMVKKVFLISVMYPSIKNPGHGIFVKNIEENLQKEGVEFVDKAVVKGVSYNFIFQLFNYIILYAEMFLKGFIRRYDFIYVHYISHSTLGVLVVSSLRNKPVVFNIHGTDLLSKSIINRISRRMVAILIRQNRVKGFVVPSVYFKNKLLEKFNFPTERIIVSPSGGINTNVFKPIDNHRIQNNKYFNIGYVSRIEGNKGWILFVALVNELKLKNINIKAVIVGKGPQQEDMINEIIKMNLENEIDYLGVVNQFELARVYNSLDLFIFPTMADESLGLVGLEAMACGTITLGSNIGGINSYIDHNINGLLFEQGNKSDLLTKTVAFYKLPNFEKEKLSKKAFETSIGYSSDKITKDLVENLNKL